MAGFTLLLPLGNIINKSYEGLANFDFFRTQEIPHDGTYYIV
ncbi:hypothetical protein BAOM_p008 (plasmid) [Peribacillus asahii]|uniref:Uncharacterized protein n=1 Tax=Peribacillus asahii TaxID=228899 RepID=A0A3Q9RSD4_9BACI|nr:hypothetical protein BAOM_p008 [Peribacillus asahii]